MLGANEHDELPVRRTYRFASVPEWVVDHPALTGDDVRLYAILDRHAGRAGECWPSLRSLAEKQQHSVDTVRRSLRRLREAGAIAVEPRYEDGRQTSNRVVLAGDAPLAAVQGVGSTPARDGGSTPARDGGSTPARPGKRARGTRATGTKHPTSASDAGDLTLVAQPPPSAGVIAGRWYDHVVSKTGVPPIAPTVPAVAKMVGKATGAGHDPDQVLAAVIRLWDRGAPLTMQTLDRELRPNGKATALDRALARRAATR